jgi:hypothetical protein
MLETNILNTVLKKNYKSPKELELKNGKSFNVLNVTKKLMGKKFGKNI